MNSNLKNINKLGQSIWYDNLSRDVLVSGELAKLVAEGVTGLTSNPTIFKQAIADTNNYDQLMNQPGGADLSDAEICESLMISDVAEAADLLKPIYNSSNKIDGYASIEVSPFLARDTQATLVEAERLWEKLSRPNIMIKVPATAEGIPAIEELIFKGINVNVTLIFSKGVYEMVANAFIKGLERRAALGKNVDSIASVASFFVSRVDSIVEKYFDDGIKADKLTEAEKAEFDGFVGIANSLVAYETFKQIFSSARFSKLSKDGAQEQRPLWASTGTKNPKFDPLLYVKKLAGPKTVNTLPPKTLKSLMEVSGHDFENMLDRSNGGDCLGSLRGISVPIDNLLMKLQEEGVDSFAKSYTDLLDAIKIKRSK